MDCKICPMEPCGVKEGSILCRVNIANYVKVWVANIEAAKTLVAERFDMPLAFWKK